MKKFLAILILLIAAISGFSQDKVKGSSPYSIYAGDYVYLGATTADTLKNGVTKTYILRLRGDQTFDIKSQVYINHVSGTAAYKVYTYNSIDGTNWTAKTADSLTIASITADQLHGTALSFSDVMDVYKKIEIVQTGTAVTIPEVIIVARKN